MRGIYVKTYLIPPAKAFCCYIKTTGKERENYISFPLKYKEM